ncbi:MAG: RNA polymerase sigma-70 factor [Tannerella sp.]|jgi:RNA polymerase sigma-70 factor (ECF subfamily)|nr:RNA polymerase sigma-70 factor [Tannerella sp.]
MMVIFDKNFSARIVQGDREAFDELFRLFYNRLFRFAQGYLNDECKAEDIVQDAFLMLWERHDTLRPDSHVPAWLLTVVRNRILNHVERMKRQVESEQIYARRVVRDCELSISSLSACDPEQMFGHEVEQIIRRAIDALPEKTREIILMSRFDDMSNREIADKLNLSVKSVEYHITQALKKLRLELKDYIMFALFFL